MSDSVTESTKFVGRAGYKLEHALKVFALDVHGLHCADFGCNIGGFTDCLLKRGATQVFAIDTGYGALDWALRKDARVVTMERTNAMHADPPSDGVDLVVVDVSWTPLALILPNALRWLRSGGRIIALIKPHYEASHEAHRPPVGGVLARDEAEQVARRVLLSLKAQGVRVTAWTQSPLEGGSGNTEFLALLERA
ncbi:MAG: methyltransferase domain-containing protein [Planctomycetota bacterium]|nr:methyltransferase domain-containing protein [Planctomycetota bacterium]